MTDLRVTRQKVEEIDRHGYVTVISPQFRRHTIELSDNSKYSIDTSRAPTLDELETATLRLLQRARNGYLNERKQGE